MAAPGPSPPTEVQVVNISAASLRGMGYSSLRAWLDAAPGKHVYIGRPVKYVEGTHNGPWGNPFSVERYGRAACIAEYEAHLRRTPALLAKLPQLRGCVLGCWCKPETCHGDVLAAAVAELKA